MPEYSFALTQPEPVVLPKPRYRESKYWIRAKRRKNNRNLLITNDCTEFYYHLLLKEVKELYAPRNEFVFERDYKRNPSESLFPIHEFQCESLFIQLWCCFSEYYFVDFDFHNCPFEQEIREHFKGGMLYTQNRHFLMGKDFFQHTMQNQDQKFFYYLKVETDD